MRSHKNHRNAGRTGLEVRLLRLYPRAWRDRYGDEFAAMLEQTGVGWIQVIDVLAAASREWVKAMVRWRSLRPLANEVRRGLIYFSLAWFWTGLFHWVFGDPATPRLGDTAPQIPTVGLFVVSALVCNLLERSAFRFVLRGRATHGELTTLSVGAFLLMSITVDFVARARFPSLLALPGGIVPFVMMGEFFGRPALGNRTSVHDVGLGA